VFAGIVICVPLILRLSHGRNNGAKAPWKYFYAGIIYIACIPGTFALFFLLYLAVFQSTNILNLSIVSYYLPVLAMVLSLIIIRKIVNFDEIPGFKKILGLMALVLCTFLILLILDRLRIFLFFRGSFLVFLALWIGIFIVIKIGLSWVFGRLKR
jgi:hypothetical protein